MPSGPVGGEKLTHEEDALPCLDIFSQEPSVTVFSRASPAGCCNKDTLLALPVESLLESLLESRRVLLLDVVRA